MMDLFFLILDFFFSVILIIIMVFATPKIASFFNLKIIFKIEKKEKDEIIEELKEKIELFNANKIFLEHKKQVNKIRSMGAKK